MQKDWLNISVSQANAFIVFYTFFNNVIIEKLIDFQATHLLSYHHRFMSMVISDLIFFLSILFEQVYYIQWIVLCMIVKYYVDCIKTIKMTGITFITSIMKNLKKNKFWNNFNSEIYLKCECFLFVFVWFNYDEN